MKTPQEQALEAFEKWYSQGNKFCPSLQKTENRGEGTLPYRLIQTHNAWEAWQAAWNTRATPSLEAIIAKIEAMKWDNIGTRYQLEVNARNTTVKEAISIIREEWGK